MTSSGKTDLTIDEPGGFGMPDNTEEAIALLRHNIDNGICPRRSKQTLDLILARYRKPTARRDWIEERLTYLTNLRAQDLTTDEDRCNIDAVVQHYRDGTLRRPAEGKGVIYYAGVKRTGEIEIEGFDWGQAIEWSKGHRGKKGRIFIEAAREKRKALLSQAVFHPTGLSFQHKFYMRVSPLGGTSYVDLQCLEDTGSTNFCLFKEDLSVIGVDARYLYWLDGGSIQVVGTTLKLPALLLQLQVLSNGPGSGAIGKIFYDECYVLPGSPADHDRLSGMGLHRHLFVATAPDGFGVQYIAKSKAGLVVQLLPVPS